jgi:hypothetical protein
MSCLPDIYAIFMPAGLDFSMHHMQEKQNPLDIEGKVRLQPPMCSISSECGRQSANMPFPSRRRCRLFQGFLRRTSDCTRPSCSLCAAGFASGRVRASRVESTGSSSTCFRGAERVSNSPCVLERRS